jgi:hypothetical protein
MEIFVIEEDINVLCQQADSFPQGVMQAHTILHNELPDTDQRKFAGISYPDKNGAIIYKAAAEALYDNEAEQTGFESFTIKRGNYITEFITDFCVDTAAIGKAFKTLLSHPDIDPNGYCLEMYTSDKDVRCMVPLIASTLAK